MTIKQIPDDQTPAAIPADDEGLHVSGSQSFEEFGASLPVDANSFLSDATPSASVEHGSGEGVSLLDSATAQPEGEVITSKAKRIKLSRKMQKAMDKLKAKTSKLPIMYFHNKAKKNPEWELDDDEKEIIEDAFFTVFEVLDIEIQIEPLNITLQSIWWILSYPMLAFVFLFLTKKSAVIERENAERGIGPEV